jgi:SAM-dependent methyltransferase
MTKAVRVAAWLVIAGQLAFIASWIVAGALEPHYSPVRDYVSELGGKGTAHPWIVNTGIAVMGLSVALVGPALVPTLRRPYSRATLAALFLFAGATLGLASVFRLDCSTTMSSACDHLQSAGKLSTEHYIHGWLAFVAEIALICTPFVLARAVWRRLLSLSLIQGGLFGLTIAVLGLFVVHGSSTSRGLEQRIELGILQLWVILLACALLLWARAAEEGPTTLGDAVDRFSVDVYWRMFGFSLRWPRVVAALSRLQWGGSARPFFASLAAFRRLPPGATVVDVPCRSGAWLGLTPDQDVRYVAIDPSEERLAWVRRVRAQRGLHQLELVRAEPAALPVEDACADVVVSHWGLHWVPDPAGAVRELARCAKPGGALVGSMVCSGPRLRQRMLVHPGTGGFGPTGSVADLRGWLEHAGFEAVEIETSGPFAYFRARARAGAPARAADTAALSATRA